MDDISRYFEDLGLDSTHTQQLPVHGGHMSYKKSIHINDSEKIFVKTFVSVPDLTEKQSDHAVAYLQKENSIINQLSAIDTVPEHSELISSSLIMPAYLEDLGWYWQAPEDQEFQEKYIDDILSAITEKESLQINFDSSIVAPSQKTFEENGWQKLAKITDLETQVIDKIKQLKSKLHPTTFSSGYELVDDLDNLIAEYAPIDQKKLTAFTHHDARQHNIAWHPELGVRIVDWSWAGVGLPNSDSTMFLIDLTKSEIDISQYLEKYFNSQHAHTLIGYWLARSLEEPSKSNPQVRLHQLASAITAYNLYKYTG
ncbi:MAG: hypothetical protein AAB914_04695 [Patescibacteria group bacterium]